MHVKFQRAHGRPSCRPLLIAALLGLATLTTQAQTPSQPAGSTATTQAAKAMARDARVSQLIGKDVRNPKGEKLGEINDLIIDVNNQLIHYAILSFGGFMGLGDKLFAYPLTVFQHTPDRDELLLDIDKERLQKAPGFEREHWPDWSAPDYNTSVERHLGKQSRIVPRPDARLLRASSLMGKNVDDNQGRNAGEVEDLVVSMSSGRVHYVVLDFDRSWNMNDRLLPLPLKSLRFPADADAKLVLMVPRERLDQKLGFDKKLWPEVNDPNFRRQVDATLMRLSDSSR